MFVKVSLTLCSKNKNNVPGIIYIPSKLRSSGDFLGKYQIFKSKNGKYFDIPEYPIIISVYLC